MRSRVDRTGWEGQGRVGGLGESRERGRGELGRSLLSRASLLGEGTGVRFRVGEPGELGRGVSLRLSRRSLWDKVSGEGE